MYPRTNRALQAEARIRRLMTKYGVPNASAKNLPAASVQGTLMYAAELTWNGRKGMKGECQTAINRMGLAGDLPGRGIYREIGRGPRNRSRLEKQGPYRVDGWV